MSVDSGRYREVLKRIHPGTLAQDDADTIVELAQLAVDADGQEDAGEVAVFFALGKAVYALAGADETPSPAMSALDEAEERVLELAAKLKAPARREVAYAVVLLMTTADARVVPEEQQFLQLVKRALGVTDDRAAALATTLQ